MGAKDGREIEREIRGETRDSTGMRGSQFKSFIELDHRNIVRALFPVNS